MLGEAGAGSPPSLMSSIFVGPLPQQSPALCISATLSQCLGLSSRSFTCLAHASLRRSPRPPSQRWPPPVSSTETSPRHYPAWSTGHRRAMRSPWSFLLLRMLPRKTTTYLSQDRSREWKSQGHLLVQFKSVCGSFIHSCTHVFTHSFIHSYAVIQRFNDTDCVQS